MIIYVPVRRKKRGVLPKLFILTALLVTVLVGWKWMDRPSTITGQGSGILGIFAVEQKPLNQEVLQERLKTDLAEFERRGWKLGIFVKDIKTESSFSYHKEDIFEAASLTKVPVLLTLYEEVQQGRLNLSQKLEIKDADVQDYGTSVMLYKGPGTKYTLGELAWYMANRSDNTAYEVLSSYFGTPKINSNLHEWGFPTYDILRNQTTPAEMVRIFDLIYQERIVRGNLAKEMMNLMVKTHEESRIPGSLPSGTRVIHKTGNAIGGVQDAGVVELADRPYVVAILTDNVNDERMATEIIKKISQVIYEYIRTL